MSLLQDYGQQNHTAVNAVNSRQCLSQDLETGCLKLAVVKFLGVQILKGITLYSYFNHKHV